MKRSGLFLFAVLCVALGFGLAHVPLPSVPVVEAQSGSAKANHITKMRVVYTTIIEADSALQALINEANDNSYVFVDNDFTGPNLGITAANYSTALVQAQNWNNALRLGVAVGGGASATLPSGLRGVFNKVAK